MTTTEETVARLNAWETLHTTDLYDPDTNPTGHDPSRCGCDIWEQLIYSLDYDEAATDRHYSETDYAFVTVDGSHYRYDMSRGEWVAG